MQEIRKNIRNNLISLGKKISASSILNLDTNEIKKQRFIKVKELCFDFSKQRINKESLEYLLSIPDLINLRKDLNLLFKGEIVNPSESRLVTHTIYREKDPIENFSIVYKEREKINKFLSQIKSSRNLKNLVCLCIGGSRLGTEILSEFQSEDEKIKVHFCSSYDLLELKKALSECEYKDTVFFVLSKSFETQEIIKNLNYVKSWFELTSDYDLVDNLYGVSSNSTLMSAHGIKKENQFQILDSLGGRFSVWSSMSLPAFVNTGFDSYLSLLEGAKLADKHTQDRPWESNIAVLMALLSIWNSNALNINNHGIFTYNYNLRSLSKYITQLSMESNGKSINYNSEESPFYSSPLVWGGYGIESQHSTFQWLMQSKSISSCDFIGTNDGSEEFSDSQEMLLSQVIALTYGEVNRQEPFKSVKGNNPCSIFQLNSCDIKSLGYLLALYEHKVFVEALILGIDPFDQWGVQLGKKLVKKSREDMDFLGKFFPPELHPRS